MIDFDKKLDEILYKKWFILNTEKGKLKTSMVDVGAVLVKYKEEIKSGQLKNNDALLDLHFFTEGSDAAFEWFYEEGVLGTSNKEELLKRYMALNVFRKSSLGPMYLHYLIAKATGYANSFQSFRLTRRIGKTYLMPALMELESIGEKVKETLH